MGDQYIPCPGGKWPIRGCRVTAFESLSCQPYAGALYDRLSAKEVQFCLDWLRDRAGLSREGIHDEIDRIWMDKPKPKNAGVMIELLHRANLNLEER